MITQEITIMDRAVYDMGALAGARWLQERLNAGLLADVRIVLDKTVSGRANFADTEAVAFGVLASAGGMVWHQYKRRAYATGWLAGFNAALIEEIQHGDMALLAMRLLAPAVPV